MRKAIFFDAAGTLIRLTKSVGWNYALVAQRQGLSLEAAALDCAFAEVWHGMPLRPATGQPREDDDKGWWRDLIKRLLDRVSPGIDPLDRDTFFEAAYGHFAEAGVWELPRRPGSSGNTGPAFRARSRFEFRWPLAIHSRAPRALKIFSTRLPLQRTRRGQA